jgi:hypothetical protein
VQSPILELFPVAMSPSQTYQQCGDYSQTTVMTAGNCNSRAKFSIISAFQCFPTGVTFPNIIFSMKSIDGTFLPQQQQMDLNLIDVEIKDSVVTEGFRIIRLNSNEAQISGC